MCLVLKEKEEPMIAPADIECYKIIDLHEDGTYHAHIQTKFVWELNKTLNSELIMEEAGWKYPYITKGFHSYQTLNDALSILRQAPVKFQEAALVKCIIPQGSRYYDGRINNRHWGKRGYASDALKVVEVLETKKPLPVDDNFPYKVGDYVQLERLRWSCFKSTFKQSTIVGVYHITEHSYRLDIKNSVGQTMNVMLDSEGKMM
jgi:hypothetical protein